MTRPLALPRDIGRYRLLKLLGRGGFGAVYEAAVSGPLGFSQRVAVKLVDPAVAARAPGILLALADEARLLSLIRHPNIVQLQGFEQATDPELGAVALLVLELVDGVTAADLSVQALREARPLPLPAVLSLAAQTLEALTHAHDALGADGRPLTLVHRDLKPANLMVDRAGSVRLLDFGIAWATERLVSTGAGLTKGTPPYMSPEQVLGQPLDRRSDLFVLGAVLFELLAMESYVAPPANEAAVGRAVRDLLGVRFSDRRAVLTARLSGGGRPGMGDLQRLALEELLGSLLEFEPLARPSGADAARAMLDALPVSWSVEAGRAVLANRVGRLLAPQVVPEPGATRAFPAGSAAPARPASGEAWPFDLDEGEGGVRLASLDTTDDLVLGSAEFVGDLGGTTRVMATEEPARAPQGRADPLDGSDRGIGSLPTREMNPASDIGSLPTRVIAQHEGPAPPRSPQSGQRREKDPEETP